MEINKDHIIDSCYNRCPFFFGGKEGMECTHPYWDDKGAYDNMIITHENSRGKIPPLCPLRKEKLKKVETFQLEDDNQFEDGFENEKINTIKMENIKKFGKFYRVFESEDIYNKLINNYGELDIQNLRDSIIITSEEEDTLDEIIQEYGGTMKSNTDGTYTLTIKK